MEMHILRQEEARSTKETGKEKTANEREPRRPNVRNYNKNTKAKSRKAGWEPMSK